MNFDQYLLKLQSIARIGLKFSKDPYALENYEELQALSHEMMEKYYGKQIEKPNVYERDIYPTPNVSIRTIILNEDNQILMVQEAQDGKWCVPGGWCDIGETSMESAMKEVLQETGYVAIATKLLGVLCYSKHKENKGTFGYSIGYLAKIVGGEMNPNHEILNVGYFNIDDLPELSRKMAKEEIIDFYEVAMNKKEAVFE